MGVFGRNFVLVQDNAMPHRALNTTTFLIQQEAEVLIDWPTQSPDKSPFEHVLNQMGG